MTLQQQKSITIKLILPDGKTDTEVLGGRGDYEEILQTHEVQSLKNLRGENVRYSVLEDGETYKLGRPQRQKKEPGPVCNLEIDVSNCKLSKEFLETSRLESYSQAAEACKETQEFINLLNHLGDDDNNNLIKDYSCIISPSGTGKTQLAATAARTGKWNVAYFYVGSGSDGLQSFYLPHLKLRNELIKAVRDFSGRTKHGAEDISVYEGRHSLFKLLCKCFLNDTNSDTVADLQRRLKNEELLVFLDEVPEASDNEFTFVMLLRNVLRASGVSPILMSTHSGAINAVKQGSNCRSTHQRWCRVFVKLPSYQAPAENVWKQNPWLLRTERPLVISRASNDITEKEDISKIVDKIQEELQDTKSTAWLDCPSWQLCQLFRSKDGDIFPDSSKHRIVGYHFGHISAEGPFTEVRRRTATFWMQNQLVQFVNPEMEPILFLALTTWKRDMIDASTERFFPLMGKEDTDESANKRRRLTIRGSFEESSQFFTKNVPTENDAALKLSGDDLEALALAAITLASLRWKEHVFDPVPIATFLADVFWYMRNQPLNGTMMDETAAKIKTLLEGTPFSNLEVPSCPSAGSCFSVPWKEQDVWSKIKPTGRITRPADREGRDGILECDGKTILHVECKNVLDGLTTGVLKKVIGNMRADSNVSLLFTSDVESFFESNESYKDFMESDLALHKNAIGILVLEPTFPPRWLNVQKNELILEPVEGETQYLLVLIATGAVESKRSVTVAPSVPNGLASAS